MRAFKLLLSTGAVGLVMTGIAIGASGRSTPSPEAFDRSREGAVPALVQHQAAKAYAKLPVSFVENEGQTDSRVRYFAQGAGYSFFMMPPSSWLVCRWRRRWRWLTSRRRCARGCWRSQRRPVWS